jgi:hypothetical protein
MQMVKGYVENALMYLVLCGAHAIRVVTESDYGSAQSRGESWVTSLDSANIND